MQGWTWLPSTISPCGPSAEDLRLQAEAERLRQEQARLAAEKATAAEHAKAEAVRLAAEHERLRQEQERIAKERATLTSLAASVSDLIKRQTATPEGQPVDPAVQGKAEGAVTAIADKAAGTDAAAETERALQLIKDGKANEGLAVLAGLAAAKQAQADQQKAEAVAQWRRIGELARPFSTAKALAAYEQVVALDRSDPWDSIYLGRLYVQAGNVAKARATFEAALARLPEREERTRGVLASEIADIAQSQGNLPEALKFREIEGRAMQARAETEPENAERQRDLSVSHNKIGDVLRDQGDGAGALAAYRASHAIFEKLAADDPGNAGWQRDVAVSYVKLALFSGSGVTWAEVAAKWQALADRGILRPTDRKYLEAVKAKAAKESQR